MNIKKAGLALALSLASITTFAAEYTVQYAAKGMKKEFSVNTGGGSGGSSGGALPVTEFSYGDNTVYSDCCWTSGDPAVVLSDGDKTSFTGSTSVQLYPAGSYFTITIPQDSTMELTTQSGYYSGVLNIVNVDTGGSASVDPSSQPEYTVRFNLKSGTYRVVGTGNTIVTEFVSVAGDSSSGFLIP